MFQYSHRLRTVLEKHTSVFLHRYRCSQRILHHRYRAEPYKPVEAKPYHMQDFLTPEYYVFVFRVRHFVRVCMVCVEQFAVLAPVHFYILWQKRIKSDYIILPVTDYLRVSISP